MRRLGRRRVDPGRSGSAPSAASRAAQNYEITTHRAEAYRPDSRKPEVVFGDDIEDDLSRRDFTVNAMALRLPDLELIDPFDGLGRPGRRPAAHPARPRGLLRRRPAAHAAGGPVHRPLSTSSPTPDLVAAVQSRCTTGWPSSRPSGSATSWTRSWWSPCPRRRCGSSCAPAWPTSSCPSCPAWPSSRTRSTGTRTCWPTPWPWWTRPRPTACSAWPPSSTTWASPRPGPSRTAGSPSTTTRWWGPG